MTPNLIDFIDVTRRCTMLSKNPKLEPIKIINLSTFCCLTMKLSLDQPGVIEEPYMNHDCTTNEPQMNHEWTTNEPQMNHGWTVDEP